MGATREEFMNFLSASLTDRIAEQVRNQLPQILLEEVSNFASPVIEKMITESLNQANLANASYQPQSTYEAAATLTEFELKKILIDKMNLNKDFFSSYDVYLLKQSRQDKDKDEGPSTGSDRGFKKRKTSKEAKPKTKCYKALSENLDWENHEGGNYPFDLSKALPLITHGNHQSVPVELFINNDLKVKQSRGDIYSTKCNLADTHVSIMRKHGYGYLEDIVVRRADNALHKFKEDDVADFARVLRMFTRSLVIQKRVEDLQLRV
nr:hypothetical protein [Tanacetum cinerariifolium]